MFLPPKLIKGDPADENNQVDTRLSLLLGFRHGSAHHAVYTAFSDGEKLMRQKTDETEWFMKLSFDEFYEMTRKALANFWLHEYEQYLNHGGKEEIENRVKELLARAAELNASQQEVEQMPK